MAYVITSPCVNVKDRACVPACPVDCIYEYDETTNKFVVKDQGGNVTKTRDANSEVSKETLKQQLFIAPDECIDCNACVDPCPVAAIFAENEVPDKDVDFIESNRKVFG